MAQAQARRTPEVGDIGAGAGSELGLGAGAGAWRRAPHERARAGNLPPPEGKRIASMAAAIAGGRCAGIAGRGLEGARFLPFRLTFSFFFLFFVAVGPQFHLVCEFSFRLFVAPWGKATKPCSFRFIAESVSHFIVFFFIINQLIVFSVMTYQLNEQGGRGRDQLPTRSPVGVGVSEHL